MSTITIEMTSQEFQKMITATVESAIDRKFDSNSNYGNSLVGAGQAGTTFAKRITFSPACLALFVTMIVGHGRDGAELASHVCPKLYRAIPPLQHNWNCCFFQ